MVKVQEKIWVASLKLWLLCSLAGVLVIPLTAISGENYYFYPWAVAFWGSLIPALIYPFYRSIIDFFYERKFFSAVVLLVLGVALPVISGIFLIFLNETPRKKFFGYEFGVQSERSE